MAGECLQIIVSSSPDMLIDSTGDHQHNECPSTSNTTVLESLLGRSLGRCLGMLLCLSPAIDTCAPGSEAVLRSHHCRPQDHHQGRSLSAVATGDCKGCQVYSHSPDSRIWGNQACRQSGSPACGQQVRDSCSLDMAGRPQALSNGCSARPGLLHHIGGIRPLPPHARLRSMTFVCLSTVSRET